MKLILLFWGFLVLSFSLIDQANAKPKFFNKFSRNKVSNSQHEEFQENYEPTSNPAAFAAQDTYLPSDPRYIPGEPLRPPPQPDYPVNSLQDSNEPSKRKAFFKKIGLFKHKKEGPIVEPSFEFNEEPNIVPKSSKRQRLYDAINRNTERFPIIRNVNLASTGLHSNGELSESDSSSVHDALPKLTDYDWNIIRGRAPLPILSTSLSKSSHEYKAGKLRYFHYQYAKKRRNNVFKRTPSRHGGYIDGLFRIATYNVHKFKLPVPAVPGDTLPSRNTLKQVLLELLDMQADVYTLQEVQLPTDREDLKFFNDFVEQNGFNVVYKYNMPKGIIDTRMQMILTTHPIISSQGKYLKASITGRGTRSFISATIKPKGKKPIQITTTHSSFGSSPKYRIPQWEAIQQFMENSGQGIQVVTGDLNDVPSLVEQSFGNYTNYPFRNIDSSTYWRGTQLDYTLIHKKNSDLFVKSGLWYSPLSDHNPVITDMVLPDTIKLGRNIRKKVSSFNNAIQVSLKRSNALNAIRKSMYFERRNERNPTQYDPTA